MSCNIRPNRTDYYISEEQDFDDFRVDQTVLIREEYLKKIQFLECKDNPAEVSQAPDFYPYVNSYYNNTEDSDPISKVNSLLAQPDVLETIIEKQAEQRKFLDDAYSEREAQIRYLESKPVSFIILGKPDIGQQELGRHLAHYWNCINIEPETLIGEEINSSSRAGECIEFNLRCGRAVGIDIILKLVEKRVKSESAQHRGFVIAGLPVIPNDLYEDDPESSQSAVFTAKDIFEELFGAVTDVHLAPSKPQVSVSSKYKSDAEESAAESQGNDSEKGRNSPRSIGQNEEKMPLDVGDDVSNQEIDIGQNYDKQLGFLFKLLEEPYFIIYIQSGTIDVLNKRASYRFDIASNQILDTQRKTYNKIFQNFLITENDLNAVEDIFDSNFLDFDDFRQKYLVKLPRDFNANVSSQLDRYHYAALNFIQNRVIAHEPDYLIKVDGRTTITKMLGIIKERLKIMNLQQVLEPKKLTETELDTFFNTEETLLAEDQETPHSEVDTKNFTPEECFKQFKKRQAPGRAYTWTWSEWESRCPVSMKNGFIRKGNVKYPVQFMNKIFFLADHASYLKFYRNPRPFLLPPYPRASCKIFIFGPPLSGRSALAQCLGYFLNGTVLSTVAMMKEFMHQRQDQYLEKIKQQAIAEGIALLNKQRKIEAEALEKERIERIKEWVKTVLTLLEQMSNILDEIEKEENKEKFEISSFPMAMKRVQTTDVLEDSDLAIALSKIREELNNINIPIYKMDIPTWKTFFTERKKLLAYLPTDLTTKARPKPATVFDDFVKEYVENALSKAGFDNLQITGGSILEMFVEHIKAAEQKYLAQGLGQGGWIVDGMLCNLEIIKDFYPDYVGDDIIILQDDNKFLLKRYEERSSSTFFRDFRDFFMTNGMQDAAWRSPSVTSTNEYKEGLVQNILDEILESDGFFDKPEGDEASGNVRASVEQYKKEIYNFKKNWLQVKQFYLDRNIKPMEINVSNKTLPELFQEVIKIINDTYSYKAHQFTEEDRSEEITKLGDENIDDQAAGEDVIAAASKSENTVEKVRRYGDTYNFCPVTFSEDFVLWRGKEDFGVKYNDKVYLLSTKADMEKFLESPSNFLPLAYPEKIPPPRICVIGVSGCGKTFLSKAISENYGLVYLSYETFLKQAFGINTNETLNEIQNDPGSALRSYLKGDKPLPEHVLAKLRKFWFDEPFRSRGFVFDDFPKSQYDFDIMIKNKLIPEIVMLPQADETYIKTKLVAKNLQLWQKNVDKQRLDSEIRHNKALEKWKEQRIVRFNVLMEEKREQRYTKKVQDKVRDTTEGFEEDATELEVVSQVSFDSVAEQEDTDEVNKILDAEIPPLIFDVPIEDPQTFISKTEPLIAAVVQSGTKAIKKIKEKCLSHQITFTEIPLNLDDVSKTKIASFLIIEPLKFRSSSFFESCYDVSLEVADRLLSSGYFFLSKFGKTCPVQYYENRIPVQMYLIAQQKYNLFPIIHRSYIYFIVGAEQKLKFKGDPLKYIKQEFRFPLIHVKVGITGPPKSGKTTLAQRLQNEFGFKLVSRGQAVRYVLKYLSESDLAKNMESVLRRGWELTDEMVVRAVEAATFDKSAMTQGVVFDGFPNSLNEVKHLSFIDLVPNLVIDLQANEAQIFECLANDYPRRSLPKYGQSFIRHLYREWREEAEEFRFWFDREYQVITKISTDTCNWSVWNQSKRYLESTLWEIKHYHKHIVDDWPLRLGNMLVTPLEFLERQSNFKSYCPLCLHYSNGLNNGGEPPDRTGLVQYRKYFYWLCNDHIDVFLKSPEMYLPPYTKHGIPSDLPKRCSFSEMPENVYEDGACAVCYKTKRIITKGILSLSATYNEKAYLFDSVECLDVFLRNPQTFLFGIDFRTPVYPDLKYHELPVLGMLEQYVAKYIVQGISYIARRRPVIPGLGISASALVGLGIFIKIKNEQLPARLKPYYEEGFRLYNERRDNLLKYLDVMKTYRNPYLHYQELLPIFELPPASVKSESLTTMVSRIVDKCVDDIDIYLAHADSEGNMNWVPVPDERFDYLCEYFKPLSKVPAFLSVVDIAGLVKGASEGQGLGNAFLSHISACDAIFHLCRAFEDDDVTHVEGEVNPVRDLDIIAEELRLKDEEQLMKHLDKLERTVVRGNDKKQKPEYDALAKVKTILVDEKKHIRFADWDVKDIDVLNKYLFLTSKPCIYLVNLSEKDYIKKKNKWLIKIKEWIDKNDPGSLLIPFSGSFEYKIANEIEDPVLRKKYLEDNGTTSALDKIIVQGYKALQLEYFFTSGADEVKAWTIQKGTKAPQAAGKIHTDFEKGFIMAEVMKFHDFKEEGSEAACKAGGKYRQQGRNYVVEDGDIIFFKFNAGAGLKEAKKK